MLAIQGIAAGDRAWVTIVAAVSGVRAAIRDGASLTLTGQARGVGAGVPVITIGIDGAAASVREVFALAESIAECVRARVAIISAV